MTADEALAAADARLFPSDLLPMTADALKQYEWITSRFGPVGYGAALAAAHARALASNPDLAALMRSPEAVADVGEAATVHATPADDFEPIAVTCSRARSAAITAYKQAVAKQIAEAASHPLGKHARAFLAAARAREQAEAERIQLAEEARAELERQAEAERVAAEAAAELAAAELAAAAAAQQTAEAAVRATVEAHRSAHARWFVATLKGSGLARLRTRGGIGGFLGRGVYTTEDLIAQAPMMSIEQLSILERALSDELEKEDAP
jgi:hypothetical protein